MRFPSPFPYPQRSRGYGSSSLFGRRSYSGGVRSAIKGRLLIALIIIAFAVISYYGKPGDVNQVTGEAERVALTEEADEIQLGLQAAGEITGQHGGPSRDIAAQRKVQNLGQSLIEALDRDL